MDAIRSVPAGSGRLRRVLLVDGNVHVLHVMKSSLDRHGYEVDTALAADVARALHRESRHDVVVIDADAHGRSGEALAAELLAGDGAAPAPLVILVGGTDGAPGTASASGSAPERWSKPVSLRYLVARLAEHFGHYAPAAGAA